MRNLLAGAAPLLRITLPAAADLLLPPACVLCSGRLADARLVLCGRCADAMRPLRSPVCVRCGLGLAGAYDAQRCCARCTQTIPRFDAARAPWWFCGPMRDTIHQFKYRRRWRLGRRLADDMAALAASSLPLREVDAVVPVPLHWAKRWARGFNPAEELAVGVARRIKKPCWPTALRRVRWTGSQTRLRGAARRGNVSGAFAARRALPDRSLLLVDDVFTSGATVSACASALKEAGARAVFVVTAARTPFGRLPA